MATNIIKRSQILRVHLQAGVANVMEDCDIMMDQLRAIDNKRWIRKIGTIPPLTATVVKENLKAVLDFE